MNLRDLSDEEFRAEIDKWADEQEKRLAKLLAKNPLLMRRRVDSLKRIKDWVLERPDSYLEQLSRGEVEGNASDISFRGNPRVIGHRNGTDLVRTHICAMVMYDHTKVAIDGSYNLAGEYCGEGRVTEHLEYMTCSGSDMAIEKRCLLPVAKSPLCQESFRQILLAYLEDED